MPTYSLDADPSKKYEFPEKFVSTYNDCAEHYRQNPTQGEMTFRFLWDLMHILSDGVTVKEAQSFEVFKRILKEAAQPGKQYRDGDLLGSTLIEH